MTIFSTLLQNPTAGALEQPVSSEVPDPVSSQFSQQIVVGTSNLNLLERQSLYAE